MANSLSRTIHDSCCHYGWDNTIEPVARVRTGEELTLDCRDAADGQLTLDSTPADIVSLDPERVNPVTGPVFVDGAVPGDALEVTILGFEPSGFGWTAVIPGFGLLADQFPEPHLALWTYDRMGGQPLLFGDMARIPLRPFAGTMGVVPAEPGRHSIIPPRRVGGNLDIRDLVEGTTLILPVEVEGALFSVGDTHAAQGDGEVCGTAIESAMAVSVRLDVVRNGAPPTPRFTTPGPVSRHIDQAGYDVTTGVGPDLMQAARDSVGAMIDLLATRHAMAAGDAYMLCSVCGDLRISEIVDAPNWVVSFYMPRQVFD